MGGGNVLGKILCSNHSRASDYNSSQLDTVLDLLRLQLKKISCSEQLRRLNPALMLIERRGQSFHLEPHLGGDWCLPLW